jgi:lipopolysaccharide transport system ATP-binding protein
VTAISVQGLSKRYVIGSRRRATSFREAMTEWVRGSLRRRPAEASKATEYWALRDVSFDVQQGERLGVIGANGAGKSTLLKILSRVTPPSAGRVTIAGRVSSLLEVGTGFHPELTGRENIFLNGAILGMRAAEIRKKFDEIVDFAEVEQFLDTPVKRYSSGMYVRLAFAVAAHLDPDVLIVDEVLAVGDARFQRKSLSKMENAAKEGRTVVFVSHSMAAVKNLCHSALLLDRGRATDKMPVESAINRYLALMEPKLDVPYPLIARDIELHSFRLSQRGVALAEYDASLPIDIQITFRLLRDLTNFRIGVIVRSKYGEIILRSLLADWNAEYEQMPAGEYKLQGSIPSRSLVAGRHVIQVDSSRFGLIDYGFWEPSAMPLVVTAPRSYNAAHPEEEPFGSLYIDANWTFSRTSLPDVAKAA